MNEHIIPVSEISSKLASLPANPPKKHELDSKRHLLIAGAAALVVLAAVGATWWASAARSTVHYVTAPVTRGIVARAVTATGTVNPELTIIVGAAVSGIIQELYCDYNTQVKKGQVCAKIGSAALSDRRRPEQGQSGRCQSATRKRSRPTRRILGSLGALRRP